jgi:hypothetical protein
MSHWRSCLALSAALLASPVFGAEDPVVTRVVIWKAKPGMAAKLEAGLKVHNAFHGKKGDPMPHHTYVVTSGPNTGDYVRVAGGRNWKDFDAEAAWGKEDQADSAINTDPYLASAMPMYYRMRADLSHMAPGSAPAAMYSLAHLRLKIGRVDDYEQVSKQGKEAADKAKWPRYWTVFTLINGGDAPTWVISQPRDKFADFNPPEGKTFAEMLEEQLGESAARLRQEMSDASVASVFTEIIEYRADLSYTPAAK